MYKYINMSGPIFDRNHDPLGDLTLKMTDDLEPETTMETPNIENINDNIRPNVESVEKEIIGTNEKRQVNEMFVTKKKAKAPVLEGITEDVEEAYEVPAPAKIRGERGKDKKARKKRVMTPEALAKLATAREKSLAKRRESAALKKAAKEEARVSRAEAKIQARQVKPANVKLEVTNKAVIRAREPITEPANVFHDFDKFCSFMDRYDERKRKNHSTDNKPHPNQKIPERQRPRPPIQAASRNPSFSQNGRRQNKSPPPNNFSPYSLLKSGRSSVFGNSGMRNGYDNNNW